MDQIQNEKSFPINRIKIQKIYLNYKENSSEIEDEVAVDEATCVFINDEYYTTFIASPIMIKELIIGNLIGEGLIDSINEVQSIDWISPKVLVTLSKEIYLDSILQNRIGLITTACSQSKSFNIKKLKRLDASQDIKVEAETIFDISKELTDKGVIFHKTGGTHSAMLSSLKGDIEFFAEDVGRHNAVDKIIGLGVLNNYNMKKSILFCSGRLSSDIILKVARSEIPIVASVAAPLESGVKIAEAVGVTLISFVRGKRMNVYTHKNRVIF